MGVLHVNQIGLFDEAGKCGLFAVPTFIVEASDTAIVSQRLDKNSIGIGVQRVKM